jgi:hypothetical protein
VSQRHVLIIGGLALAMVAVVAGCGGQAGSASVPTPTATAASSVQTAPPLPVSAKPSAPGSGALTGEAASTAAGDIPDNQVFLVYHDAGAGYSMKYPEGWARKGNAGNVTLRDKNNIVHVIVAAGAPATIRSVKAQLAQLKTTNPSFSAGPPQTVGIGGAQATKVTYTTKSATNPVTGKSVKLIVDRYYLSHAGKVAIVDLGTPQGVDNVDAYRMMIQSFTWMG